MGDLVGVLGIGRMGLGIAARLRERGFAVEVHDVDAAARDRAVAVGLAVAVDASALAAGCDVIVTVLPGPPECRDALAGPGGALASMRPGTAWLDLTSDDPAVVDGLVREAVARGVAAVAAPMRGGPADAGRGTLGFHVAGSAAAVDRVGPVLEALGHDPATPRIGDDPASAHVVKLLGNALWFGQVVAVTEALLLGRSLGLDPTALRSALLTGPGTSAFLERHAPALLAGDPMADFGIDRVVEELDAVTRLAAERGVPHELTALVARLHRDALDAHGPVDGELLAGRLLEERAGRRLHDGV
ncbi:NAD(P)-dependent oxidoreductase [Clavibacter sp. km1a]|uniref:NAD(P)-dependent oxidoreductase n=1 Tax=Clavibacter sp. km1a TaxID=3459136 RepID=UPI004043397F